MHSYNMRANLCPNCKGNVKVNMVVCTHTFVAQVFFHLLCNKKSLIPSCHSHGRHIGWQTLMWSCTGGGSLIADRWKVADVEWNAMPWRPFVRAFVYSLRTGVQPTLDPSTETFWIGPMRQPRERMGVDRCVWCERYVGWRRESRLEQLVRYL